MKVLKLRLRESDYPIFIGRKILPRIGPCLRSAGISGKILVSTSRKIGKIYLSGLINHLERNGFDVFVHYLPEGEQAKTQSALFEIFDSLVNSHFDRGSSILALGGGTVGDVSGFAAASYLRGIAWTVVPTTLLAQVDSAIGGKTAINLPEGKNLIGSFYQPKLVVSDIELLKSLPPMELEDSLAEVIKYGMIRGGRFFDYLERQIQRARARDPEVLERIVTECARIKKEIVESDPTEEKGVRFLLNYGHTFAHAFEGAGSFHRIRHGSAVAVGMMAAARLALRLRLFSRSEMERQRSLIVQGGLPTRLGSLKLPVRRILKFMERDKKVKEGRLRFILPVRIGRLKVCEGIKMSLVEEALRAVAG